MSDTEGDPITVVTAWHEAVNTRDTARLGALVTDDVELVGPRGPGSGRALVLEWVERAGIHIEPARFFQHGEHVVVEQRATWTGGQGDEPQIIASVFAVRNDRVARVARYPDVAAALAAVGLDHAPDGA